MENQRNVEDNQRDVEDNQRNVERIIIERFWQRMQKTIGVVPKRVIALMDLLELSTTDALTMDRDWGATIYNDIKAEGLELFDEAMRRGILPRDRTKYDVFGRHENNMANFRLTGTETSMINSIARAARDYGIMYFIGEEEGTIPATRPVVFRDGPPNPFQAELQASLGGRLNNYFNSRPEYFGLNAFDNARVRIEQQRPNRVKVKVQCVRCAKGIGCTRVGNIWHISNYTQHVKRKHKRAINADGIYKHTRSHEQLPPGDTSDSDFETVVEEETFTSASSASDDDSGDCEGSTGSGDEEEDVVREDTEPERATNTETEPATDGRVRSKEKSRVSTLVDMFSAGPSTSTFHGNPKN